MDYMIEHNELEGKFFTVIEGLTAYIAYRITEGRLVVYSTYVPKLLEGRGIAAELTKRCYAFAEAEGYTPDATCSYAVVWLKKHKNSSEVK